MWENNSSRACSKGEGVDSLRGSERFLAMQGQLLSGAETWGRGSTAQQCNRRRRAVQRPRGRPRRVVRSEERRVGKGWGSRCVPDPQKKETTHRERQRIHTP